MCWSGKAKVGFIEMLSVVASKLFSAGLDEDWVRITIVWDWQKQQEEYFEERESRSLGQ